MNPELIKILGLPATSSEQDIMAAVAASKKRLDDFESEKARVAADEEIISQKVSAGITRQQAINVIQRQKEHDIALAEKKASRLPRFLQLISDYPNRVQARRAAAAEFPDLDGSEWSDALKKLSESATEGPVQRGAAAPQTQVAS